MTIVRGQRVMAFPTRFMLVAASNPCPCGMGDDDCSCSAADLARHHRRLSGPLLDRIDVLLAVGRPAAGALRDEQAPPSAAVRERVVAARERQAARLEAHGLTCNAQMTARLLREHAGATPSALRLLYELHDRHRLSARGHGRVLRVARTLADLDESATRRPRAHHARRRPAPRSRVAGDGGMSAAAGKARAAHGGGTAGPGAMAPPEACDACLRRTALIAALSGWLDVEWRRRDAAARVLALPDEDAARARDPGHATARTSASTRPPPARAAARAGCALVCRCAGAYPPRLRELPDPPAVLHVARRPGRAQRRPTGSRSSAPAARTGYGLEVARALGRGLSPAGRAGRVGARPGRRCRGAPGRARGQRPAGRRAGRRRRRRLSVAQPRAARGGGRARRGRVGAPAGRLGVPLVLRRAQPDHRRARAGDGGRRGHRALRLADDRRLRRRPRLHRRGRARAGSPPAPPRARTGCSSPARRWCATAPTCSTCSPMPPASRAGRPRAPSRRRSRPSCGACSTAVEEGRGALGELASGPEDVRAVLAGLGELEFRGLVRRTFGGRYEPAAR